MAPRATKMFHRDLCRWTFRFSLFFCRRARFLDVKVIDESQGQYGSLVVANHISMFDIVCMLAFFRGGSTFVSSKFLYNPLLITMILCCRYIPLAPSWRSRLRAYQRARHELKDGFPVVVFPEGTRSSNGELGPFAQGAFKMAVEGGWSVTPVFLTIDRAFLNKQRMFRPRRDPVQLRMVVGPAIAIKGSSCNNIKLLSEQVRQFFVAKMRSQQALAWNRLALEPAGEAQA